MFFFIVPFVHLTETKVNILCCCYLKICRIRDDTGCFGGEISMFSESVYSKFKYLIMKNFMRKKATVRWCWFFVASVIETQNYIITWLQLRNNTIDRRESASSLSCVVHRYQKANNENTNKRNKMAHTMSKDNTSNG